MLMFRRIVLEWDLNRLAKLLGLAVCLPVICCCSGLFGNTTAAYSCKGFVQELLVIIRKEKLIKAVHFDIIIDENICNMR